MKCYILCCVRLLADHPRNITEVLGFFVGFVLFFKQTDTFCNHCCLKTPAASKVRTNLCKVKVTSQPEVVFTIFRHFPVQKAKGKI